MSKAAVNLGTKRTCPKCALKFYDFSKPEIQCPKCGTEVDPEAELQQRQPEKKATKPKASLRDDDEEVVVGASEFESVDDLGDDDDEGLDDIAGGSDTDSDDET